MKKLNKDIEIKVSENIINYTDAVNLMQKRVLGILNNKEKELVWFLNHSHIYTCGTNSHKSEILCSTNVPIINSNRGGKITYHGPGQRIIYLVIDLNNRKKDIRKFIDVLETTIISLLLKIFINIISNSFCDNSKPSSFKEVTEKLSKPQALMLL